jgi:hypothetical protein
MLIKKIVTISVVGSIMMASFGSFAGPTSDGASGKKMHHGCRHKCAHKQMHQKMVDKHREMVKKHHGKS